MLALTGEGWALIVTAAGAQVIAILRLVWALRKSKADTREAMRDVGREVVAACGNDLDALETVAASLRVRQHEAGTKGHARLLGETAQYVISKSGNMRRAAPPEGAV